MSTVVGIVNNGKVWMGADSFATTIDGERRRTVCNKLFINGPYLFGHTGSVRPGQVLRRQFFTPPKNVLELPDCIRDHLKKKECLIINPDTQTQLLEGNFLIATNHGKLYEFLSDFQMNEVIDHTAIGSGAPFSLGSLYTTRKVYNNTHRLKVALHAAAVYDLHTGPPFIIKEFLED